MAPITVYTARKIITMNEPLPEATAVAVREGEILEVGSLETLAPWLSQHEHVIDDQFKDKVLMPGFIDPHLHPSMAAVLLPMKFITATEWRLPWETIAPVETHEAFLARLAELDAEMKDPTEPLLTWGYHQLWHGKVTRAEIDEISTTRPIIVWHRSFHELYMGTAALEWLKITREDVGNHTQINYQAGHFFETGLTKAIGALNPFILSPERYADGMKRLKQVAHYGGHTTLGDMAVGIFNLEMEWAMSLKILDTDDTPFRVHMTPGAVMVDAARESNEAALAFIKTLPERNTHRLQFHDHVKMFTDGAFFSQLMQLKAPGYIDGHAGEWLMVPETFEETARVYWNAGYKIHVHCTGDLGLELALDTLEKLQAEHPRFNHRFTIEHFGLSTPEQVRRMADLGAIASVNIYYFYELSDMYAKKGLGYERASQMARLGTLAREGITTTYHSDLTMAPALPLNSAWVAVNRINAAGNLLGPAERVSLDDAMKAITINAAYILGMEDQVGSIRAGKKADFTVLEADPYETPAMDLKDIPIWGTVFEGKPYKIEKRD